MDDRVVISVDEYRALVIKASRYDVLVNACFENADLNWQENGLNLRDSFTEPLLKVSEPEMYEDVFIALKRKKEGKDK